VLIQTVRGLRKLHGMKILHRDMKVICQIIDLVGQYLFEQEGISQTGRSKCVQNCQGRTAVYANWDAVLCQSLSLEREAL
jgi:hypothetical protein